MTESELRIIDELVSAAAAGDREAFTRIVRLMMNRIFALTYKMTGERESARDLAQETFISAWTGLKDFRGEAKFESWLYRIATNKCLNFIKQKKETVDVDVFAPVAADNPEADLHRAELRKGVLDFMAKLPAAQRAVFELRFYKGLTFEEIADLTGKAVGTAKTNYREAVIKLRQYAIEKGWR